MQKRLIGENPDGTHRFEYSIMDEPEGTALFVTGPISGTVVLADGTAYEVTEYAIPVKNEHVSELALTIHKMHHAAGRFLDVPLPE